MDSKKIEDSKNIQKTLSNIDVNLEVESANGFIVIKGYENIILIQDKDKSQVLKGEEKNYFEYFSQPIDNLKETKLSAFTNKNKNLFPLKISAMRYSMAAIVADISKSNKEENLSLIEFQEILKKIKEKLQSKNLSFHEFFFEDSLNDLLYENNDFLKESTSLFEKKYMIQLSEFTEKLSDLLAEPNHHGYSNTINGPNSTFTKLIEKLMTRDKKHINLLTFYHMVYQTDKKFNYTNLVLLGEFAERCRQEFQNSEKDQIKTLNKTREKIFDNLNYYELPIKTLPIVSCKLGDNHILLLNIHGDLFSFGDGSKGATGNGLRNFHIIPTKINFFNREKKLVNNKEIKIEKIACGSRHCLALTISKTVYSWGFGKNGRLGHGDDKDVFEPKIIEFFDITRIEKIEAADNYSAAVSCVNSLFTWGCGEFNRLGHEGNFDERTPKKVSDFSSDIVDVKCGYYCMLVLKKNELFSVGAKTLFSPKNPISNHTDESKGDNPYFKVHTQDKKISKIIYSSEKQKRDLIGFSSGFSFISLIIQDVDCKDINSQGVHNTSSEKNRIKLFIWGSIPIDNLYSNKSQSFVLINDDNRADHEGMNELSPAGTRNFEQTSKLNQRQKNKNHALPEKETISKYLLEYQKNKTHKMEADAGENLGHKKLKRVYCSENNTVILASDGSLYAFGSAEFKIAKTNDEEYIIPIQPSLKILSVGLGRDHIVVVTKNYECYGWGRNIEGQLGLGEGSATKREDPCLIEKLKNSGCLKAYARENFSVIYDNTKQIHVFGDLGFLENDSSSAKKFVPKKQTNWGEIEYFSCGPTHFVFVVRDPNGNFELKAIGSGLYGKLGYDSERDDNKYEPVSVKIEKDLLASFSKETHKLHIACSRRQTALLLALKDPADKQKSGVPIQTKSILYVWGLCLRNLFTQEQLNRLDSLMKSDAPKLSGSVSVFIPFELTQPRFQNLIDIAVTDSVFYYINSENQLEFTGDLNKNYEKHPNNTIKKEYFANKNFNKIFLGRDHAVAIDTQGKLYSWGNNNYKKLGLKHNISDNDLILTEQKEENFYEHNNLFYSEPKELKDFNKLFENQMRMNTPASTSPKQTPSFEPNTEEAEKTGIEADNRENREPAAYLTASANINFNNKNYLSTKDVGNEKKTSSKTQEAKKEETNSNDGLIAQVQTIIRNEFDDLEENLVNKEIRMKDKMKEILAKCQFLKVNETEAKALKRILFNSFTFKMADPPLNIAIKNRMKNEKYPEEYQMYKKNYKAFLSTLFNHPCYLKKIYEHLIINSKVNEERFYNIIKKLFSNMFQHEYKQVCYINLLKNLFEVYLTKKNNKDSNKKNVNSNNNNSNSNDNNNQQRNLNDYNFFSFSLSSLTVTIDFNLILKMIGFFFRQNLMFIKNQELFAASVIASIFKRYGSFVSRNDYATIFDFKSKGTKPNLYDYYYNIISCFFESMTRCPDMDTLFTNAKVNPNKNFFEMPENILILISELAKIIKNIYKQMDLTNIYQWIYKNIFIIMFKRFFKIIKDPKKFLAIYSPIIVEKKNFKNFLNGSFDCIEWALKFSLLYIIFTDQDQKFEFDDISKKLKNKLTDKVQEYTAKYKELMKYPDASISLTKKFDLKSLEEFFNYSLADNNHYINFSLDDLKFLQEKITENIDNIRVLKKDFDLMDIIFFNKKKEFFIGKENGVAQLPNPKNYIIQVNLKSRVLSNEIQNVLMRCKECKTICPKEFILANDENFFEEFDYLENSSKEGRLKKVLASCEKINNKEVLDLFKDQRANSLKVNEFKDNLYYLFNLIAVDKKKDLYIEESDILNSDKLMEIMLNEKSIAKEIEELSKNILVKYEGMKIHFDYYCNIEAKLEKIDYKVSNKKQISRKNILANAKENLERGYANKEILENGHILFSDCKILNLKKVNEKNDNSKGLSDKLSADRLNKILPYKEFNLNTLRDDKVVLALLQKDLKNISYNDFKDYNVAIQKNKSNEYVITISKISKPKSTGFFVCGKTGDNNVKSIANRTLDNDTINQINNEALKENPNPFILEDFMKINPKDFVKILKTMNFSSK